MKIEAIHNAIHRNQKPMTIDDLINDIRSD